jgi:hypothetical protein
MLTFLPVYSDFFCCLLSYCIDVDFFGNVLFVDRELFFL